ncbi:MAG TPA: serine protease, partial [Flavobacteriia bacterium]|nr:serine protease [Flavobacteriia bacterium]
VGVGVIDTGLSPNQVNLSYKFDDYYSGRYIQKYGTYIDSNWYWSNNLDGPNDRCGHGTSCVSAISAPNNNSGMFVGVAYECNMVSYRGTSDVVLNDYHEKKGVANALIGLGNRNDIKIISMSIGYPWSIGRVKDAVRYAYSKGKMIFAAGGTSTSYTNWYGVIFPASMGETIAVTGVEEQTAYNECDVCHKGSEIDFTFVMERSNNHHQPVLGYESYSSNYFGGSSVATASTAGIAALVWAKYPSWSRSQVLNRMKYAAHFYPYKNSNFGYGNIDALKAVRGY